MWGQPWDCGPQDAVRPGEEGLRACGCRPHTTALQGVSRPPRGVEREVEAAEDPWRARCPGWQAQSWDGTFAALHGLSG